VTWRPAGIATVMGAAQGVRAWGLWLWLHSGLRIVAFVGAAWHSLGCDWLCDTMVIVCRPYRGFGTP
jgi:hypothetical protein